MHTRSSPEAVQAAILRPKCHEDTPMRRSDARPLLLAPRERPNVNRQAQSDALNADLVEQIEELNTLLPRCCSRCNARNRRFSSVYYYLVRVFRVVDAALMLLSTTGVVVSVIAAAPGFRMSACLMILMAAPAATVIVYESVGYQHRTRF